MSIVSHCLGKELRKTGDSMCLEGCTNMAPTTNPTSEVRDKRTALESNPDMLFTPGKLL